MNGWLWVGVAFLFLAWTIGAYAYGRAIGFSLGMLVGSKTLATSRGAVQNYVQDGHTGCGGASDDQC